MALQSVDDTLLHKEPCPKRSSHAPCQRRILQPHRSKHLSKLVNADRQGVELEHVQADCVCFQNYMLTKNIVLPVERTFRSS